MEWGDGLATPFFLANPHERDRKARRSTVNRASTEASRIDRIAGAFLSFAAMLTAGSRVNRRSWLCVLRAPALTDVPSLSWRRSPSEWPCGAYNFFCGVIYTLITRADVAKHSFLQEHVFWTSRWTR
jgi:hypothetical protein